MSGDRYSHNIPSKANRVLNLILIALLLVTLRIWHLTFIQYDKKLEESQKPQRRTVQIPSKRGTIRDRFNIPLAINKIQYKAAILYSQFLQIPSVKWELNGEGKKVKKFKRKEYIAALSRILGEELNLSHERLEDLIYSKAALYYNIPFVIKEDLSEQQYYRLKILEKDWFGIQAQIGSKRYYPHGKTGADILGYMGAINRQEYEEILQEINSLQTYLKELEEGVVENYPMGIDNEEEAKERLKNLRGYAYGINDYIGKSGIEGRFEQELRGSHGRKVYYSDAKGNYLKELPGSRNPLSGQRLLLTISLELQEFCEQLLAQNERIRQAHASIVEGVDAVKQALLALRQPWIKGGAILAIDPKNGEILSMASYPRFDPNDFIVTNDPILKKERLSNIAKWFESESHLADIWNQKRPFEREFFDDDKGLFYDQGKALTWSFYLDRILPHSHIVIQKLKEIGTIEEAIHLQITIDKLLKLNSQTNLYEFFQILYPEKKYPFSKTVMSLERKKFLEEVFEKKKPDLQAIMKKLNTYFLGMVNLYDQVLLVDLCRLAVDHNLFNQNLLSKVGHQSLDFYHQASSAKMILLTEMKQITRDIFNEKEFKEWRKINEKEFLKQKRKEEKDLKVYAKPYIDYLDTEESLQFENFWKENHLKFLLVFLRDGFYLEDNLQSYHDYFKKWRSEIISGAHLQTQWKGAYDILQKSVEALDTSITFDYLESLRGYSDLNRPLFGKYRHLRKEHNQQKEKHLASAFYPLNGFGYGRSQVYRQASAQGSIYKLIPAYAALKQKYEEINKKWVTPFDLNPLIMIDQTYKKGKELFVGYLENGIPIPKRYKGGRLPKSSSSNNGKLDLIRAIETSSNPYFSLLAGDYLKSPQDLIIASQQFSFGSRTGIDLPGEISGKLPQDLLTSKTGLYATAIGQHTLVVTPLQTGIMLSALANGGKVLKPQIVKTIAGHSTSFVNLLKPNQTNHEPNAIETKNGNSLFHIPLTVNKEIFLPEVIRKILLEGMRKVVLKTQKESLARLSSFYHDYPEAISDYIDLKDDLVGKTSTAESVENIDLDIDNGTNVYKHVWFGGIAFKHSMNPNEMKFVFHNKMDEPELVVIVYLRFGVYGKEAAPLAAQVVNKWREIMKKYSLEEELIK